MAEGVKDSGHNRRGWVEACLEELVSELVDIHPTGDFEGGERHPKPVGPVVGGVGGGSVGI